MFKFLKSKSSANTPSATANMAANLQDQKVKFEVIINSIDDGVILLDANHVIQLFNPAAAVISGWPVDEATGISVTSVIQLVNDKGEAYPEATSPFNQVFLSTQTIRDNKANLLTRGKKQVPISLSLTPLIDASKQVTGAVAIFRDVSTERAEEAQRADFISTASHEMRTPVAAIEGYLSLALNDKIATIDNRGRDYLEKAHNATKHLGQLFQDLLTSAKAEDGRLTSHPKVVELGAFLEQLTSDLRFSAEKKGLFMDFTVGSSTGVIDASSGGGRVVRPLYYTFVDPDRIQEVITNLFDNAVKYTATGKVTIGLTGDKDVVQCYVRDTGPGIPAEDVPHLFQKFYRVDNSATRTIGGTGLGLFLSRKIVELYNGRIWVESELGKGSTFYINLPRMTPEQAQAAENPVNNPMEIKPTSTLNNP